MIIRWWIFLVLCFVSATAEDKAFDSIFSAYGVDGTLVIESLDGKERFVHNEPRATKPFLPASTFKIPHTLIALKEGVVTKESLLEWDGVERSIPSWNQHQTLASAFKNSCVWCYQSFARKIGLNVYDTYLKALHYGNEKTGSNVERFWLDGELRISAYEQIAFLKRLYREALPFEHAHMMVLKEIMVDETSSQFTLYAKTGFATSIEPCGWYVGYSESSKGVYFFAMNMKIDSNEALTLRKQITLEALQSKGILK